MRNEKGVTLVTVIITVILLTTIGGIAIKNGIDTYQTSKVVQFETYMKMIQKKVDTIMEEGIDYSSLGTALTTDNKNKLKTIIENDPNNYIETNSVTEEKLRYFSSSEIAQIFEIEYVEDDIVVNFANREVISLNGVEKNGVMHYVEYGLH